MLVLYTLCVRVFNTGALLHHFIAVSLQAQSWANIGERLGFQEFDEGIVDHILHRVRWAPGRRNAKKSNVAGPIKLKAEKKRVKEV